MQIKVSKVFENTQIEKAAVLTLKFVNEPAFWQLLAETFYDTGIEDDLITHEIDIRRHLEYMFLKSNCTVYVVPYKAWFGSKVLGYAEGNTVFENTRKMNVLSLPERIGHIGHEITHLFGYSHSHQGARNSATVRFGEVLEVYAERRLKELQLI